MSCFNMTRQGKSYFNNPFPEMPLYMRIAKLCNSDNKSNLSMIKIKAHPLRFIKFQIYL